MSAFKIIIDDLNGEEVKKFLEDHLEDMRAISPPESKHALDLEELKRSDITFWTMWHEKQLVGCGALKELSSQEGEIKSMRTSPDSRGKGLGSEMLHHIIKEAKSRCYSRVFLETGSMEYFSPAHKLYFKHGFIECEPFASYKKDPNSVFMTLPLSHNPATYYQ